MRKPDPVAVEIVLVTLPVLAEAVAVILFISMLLVWSAIGSGA